MTKNRMIVLVSCLALTAMACKKDEADADNDPGAAKPNAKKGTPSDKGGEAKPDIPKEEPPKEPTKEPTVDGSSGVDQAKAIALVGTQIDEAKVAAVFPGLKVSKEEETAEGDPTGNYLFHVGRGEEMIAVLHQDSKGILSQIDFHSDYVGPAGIEPGKSTYTEANAAMSLEKCFSGAEETGEYFACTTTKNKGVSAIFKNNGAPERELSSKQAAKELGKSKVWWISVSQM